MSCFYKIGINIAKIAIKKAHEYATEKKRVYLVVANVEHLPFRDCMFDLILSLGVIEHFDKSNRQNMIKESYQCLNKNWNAFPYYSK